MELLKKEWKTILIILWFIGITIFLSHINNQNIQLQQQNAKIISTLDSVESVVITTDARMTDLSKKVDGVSSNVEFIVAKVRRR